MHEPFEGEDPFLHGAVLGMLQGNVVALLPLALAFLAEGHWGFASVLTLCWLTAVVTWGVVYDFRIKAHK